MTRAEIRSEVKRFDSEEREVKETVEYTVG